MLFTVYPKQLTFSFIESVVTKISKFIEFTPEQKERAATVDLEEFLLRQGEKLIKSGREKRLASDHSITVRGCEWFDHASNEGGRAVSFVQKYYGKSYVEAMSMLLGESMESLYPQAKKQEAVELKPFAPPVPNANMHRVFAYLLKTRGLDADVVSYFVRRKMLYEDAAHHNAVFLGTDEGGCPRHTHLRSTNSFGKAFRLNVVSSDPRYSFHHTGADGSLYVFEAPIDMLSFISMNPRQWQEHSYVACCGTSPIPVLQMLKPDIEWYTPDTSTVSGLADNVAGHTQDIQNLQTDKADKATTLEGYGITDAMTATAIAEAIKTAIAETGHASFTKVYTVPTVAEAKDKAWQEPEKKLSEKVSETENKPYRDIAKNVNSVKLAVITAICTLLATGIVSAIIIFSK